MGDINNEFDFSVMGMEAFKRKVMYRIYCLWFLRSVYSKMALFVLLSLAASFYVSLPNIVRNAVPVTTSFKDLFGFLFANFLITDIVAKTFACVVVFSAGYTAWDVAKKINCQNITTRFFWRSRLETN